MRRLVATFALSVMVWSFAAPLAFAATAVATPLCCRRSGMHKCANETSAMPGMSGNDVRGVRSNSPDCPYRSRIATPMGVAQSESATFSWLQPPSAGFIAVVDGFFFESPLATINGQRGPPSFSL